MPSMKCQHCGLVNWGTAPACERCGSPLDSSARQIDSTVDNTPTSAGGDRGSSISAANQEKGDLGRASQPLPVLSSPTAAPTDGRYVYKMVQIAPSLVVQARQHRGQEAANYLESVVEQWAALGWEFYRVDAMSIYVPPGCLGGLFGGQATNTQYHVVTFRRAVGS